MFFYHFLDSSFVFVLHLINGKAQFKVLQHTRISCPFHTTMDNRAYFVDGLECGVTNLGNYWVLIKPIQNEEEQNGSLCKSLHFLMEVWSCAFCYSSHVCLCSSFLTSSPSHNALLLVCPTRHNKLHLACIYYINQNFQLQLIQGLIRKLMKCVQSNA